MSKEIELQITYDLFIECVWFACASAPQTYPRTTKSVLCYTTHLWRIFVGKLGEYRFIKWLCEKKIISQKTFENYKKQALSIYYGPQNVDNFDLKVKNWKIDIKTAPEPTHNYLIVPMDQWNNQPKDIYIGLKINYDGQKIKKENIFDITCQKLGKKIIAISQKSKKTIPLTIQIYGFVWRNDKNWEKTSKLDYICPENPCYRIKLNKLIPIEKLFQSCFNSFQI